MQSQIDDASHGKSTTLQQSVNNVKRQRAEHEHELQRLGNTGQEHSKNGGDEHGAVILFLVSIHMTVHSQSNTGQQTGCTDHLTNLEACRDHSCQQIFVSGHVTCIFKIDQVGDPCQPQGVLSVDHSTGIDTGLDHVLTAKGGIVHGNGKHMVQTERQQETLQSAVNKGSQDGGSFRGIGDPDAESIDAGLNNRPYQSHHQGDDGGVVDHSQRNKPLAVEEGQCIRELTEVIILIVDHTAYKTGDDAYENTHIQCRRAQNIGKVVLHQHALAEEGVNGCTCGSQHIAGHTEYSTGNTVDQDKGNYSCKSTAGALFCPGAADGSSKQNVQVGNDGPTDILHGRANGDRKANIGHLQQLAQAQHNTSRRHNRNNRHQNLAQLLEEVEVDALLCNRLHCCRLCCSDGFLLAQGDHSILTCFDITGHRTHRNIFGTFADEHRGDGRNTLALQKLQINFCHQLACFDFVSFLDMRREALALQCNAVQANMDQDLQTVLGSETISMEGFCYAGDFAIHRCVEFAVGGNDCDAVAQNLLGKYIVGNLFQRNSLAAERCQDGLSSRIGFAAHSITPFHNLQKLLH